MKVSLLFSILILFLSMNTLHAQTINIHSVGTLRSTQWDKGYTLDGDHMAGARAKLINPVNFSDSGIYKKNISIHNAYYTSGSLEAVTGTDEIDIFFFGSFGGAPYEFAAFTEAEIDSLYAWSLRGGKLIIAEQGSSSVYPMQHLGQKWDYWIPFVSISKILPVAQAKNNRIFNGPFGVVESANLGGAAQGYLSDLNKNISVLATNSTGQPTLIIDCMTRDLICCDVDAFTDLGGLSDSPDIVNEQDRFWANTIAFMDSLSDAPPPALIQLAGTTLNTGDYYGYSWMHNGNILENTDTSAIDPPGEGYYLVIVEDDLGCMDTSDVFVYGTPLIPAVKCPENITVSTDKGQDYASVTLQLPVAFDTDGIASYVNDAPATFPVGITTVIWTVTDSLGYSAGCTQSISVYDSEKPTIKCPDNYTTGTDPGRDYASWDSLGEPVTNDNVYALPVNNNAPEIFPLGNTFVLWTVYDSSGNYAGCYQQVNVMDLEDPEIHCPAAIITGTDQDRQYALIELESPAVSDNVGIVSIVNNAPNVFQVGTTIVVWSAMDDAGNISSCEQPVTVEEPERNDELFIPNIITPNGDWVNEYFIIVNLPEFSQLIIFDRAERICFQTDNYMNNWKGLDMDGIPLENGTYWYIINISDGRKYSGYVVVNRGN